MNPQAMNKNTGDGELEEIKQKIIDHDNSFASLDEIEVAIKKWAAQEANKARIEFVKYLQTTLRLDSMQEDEVETEFDKGKQYITERLLRTLDRELSVIQNKLEGLL
jgi:hypothetical protein